MVTRLLTLGAIVLSLVAFIGQLHGSSPSWTHSMGRASYLLLVFALVTAFLLERSPSVIVVSGQALLAGLAIVFLIVAVAKYYGHASLADSHAFAWADEAKRLGFAAIPLALTVVRRRSENTMTALAAVLGVAIGCGVYALALGNRNTASFLWWSVALTAAFLAASAAALVARGSVVLRAPVPSSTGGDTWSDPGVE